MPSKLTDAEITELVQEGYVTILDREVDPGGLKTQTEALRSGQITPGGFLRALTASAEYGNRKLIKAPNAPLEALHHSRVQMVKSLPKAEVIVDLGGGSVQSADGGLVLMGYPYPFRSLTIVEPPQAERHEIYKHLAPGDPVQHMSRLGLIRYLYTSMADMAPIPTGSVDMVFSGESVEHVTRTDLELVFAEVHRILKPNGYFIFDTPNRAVTEIQLRGFAERFINPDHKYEYKHAELVEMLERHRFTIEEAKGLTWTPSARQSGTLDLGDMIRHYGFFDDIENSYLLYYRCRPK